MITLHEVYNAVALWPQLVAPSTTATPTIIDIAAANGVASKVRILLFYGASDAALTALKLQGSNTNNGSDWVDISGTIFGTDVDVNGNATVLPNATDDNNIYGWLVNTQGGAFRYYKVVLTTGTGTLGANVAVFAECSGRSAVLSPVDYAQNLKVCMATPIIQQSTH